MRESNLEKGLEPPRIGPFGLTRQILNTEGIGGLFHGLRPTFMREMPGYFCFFFAYEFTREMFVKEGKKNICTIVTLRYILPFSSPDFLAL